MDASAGEPLFADPFGGLDSPWEPAARADPFAKQAPPQQQQQQKPPPQQSLLQPQPRSPPRQVQAAPPLPVARSTFAASPRAEHPLLIVRQQQPQQTFVLDRGVSADMPRSQLHTTKAPANVRPPPAPAAGVRKRNTGGKACSRAAAKAAAPPSLVASEQAQQQRQQAAPPVHHQPQQLLHPQREALLPAQGAKRALPVPAGPEAFRLPGISLPLPLPAPAPLAQAQPPAERWVLLDASCRRPVKRGASCPFS